METGNNLVAGGVLTGVGLSGAKIAAGVTVGGAVVLLAAEAATYGLDKYYDRKVRIANDAEQNGTCKFLKNNLEGKAPCKF